MDYKYLSLNTIFYNKFTENGNIFRGFPDDLFVGLTKTELSIDCFSKIGNKFGSPLLINFINSDNIITDDNVLTISTYIYNKHKQDIEHLKFLNTVTYNPLHNYERNENITKDTTKTNTDKEITNSTIDSNNNYKETTTDTFNNVKDTASGSLVTQVDVSGYNSSSLVADNKNTETDTRASTKSGSQTSEFSLSGTKTNDNKVTDHGSKDTNYTEHEYSSTTDGNIGVMTAPDMIEKEVNLWSINYNFYNELIKIISNELTLGVY